MRGPADLGLPPKFKHWRKGQEKIFEQALMSRQRFNIINAGTGSGKSVTALALAMADEQARLVYLTATRALQDQILGDFSPVGLTDIRGRANYVCNIDTTRTAGDAKCTSGVWCEKSKLGGCDYYDQREDAKGSRLVLSNYAWWLHDEEAAAIGRSSLLVCDEAHKAVDEIARFAAVEISDRELEDYGLPKPGRSSQSTWKVSALHLVEHKIEARKPATGNRGQSHSGELLAWLKRGHDLTRKLKRLCKFSEQEILYTTARRGWHRWEVLNPGALAEDMLFRGAAKVVLVSATVNRKTLELLGVGDRGIRVVEQESNFPVANRPIYYWPVARVGQNMDANSQRRWERALGWCVGAHAGEKGLIHSVSYARAGEIGRILSADYGRRLIVHQKDRPLGDCVDEFRRRDDDPVLISPAVMEGHDFPGDLCRWNLIPKVPFPDMRDPLVKARKKRDRDYIPYVVLQHIVQAAGRHIRTPTDKGPTYILDGHFGWLKAGYYEYMPASFKNAIRTIAQNEKPPVPR